MYQRSFAFTCFHKASLTWYALPAWFGIVSLLWFQFILQFDLLYNNVENLEQIYFKTRKKLSFILSRICFIILSFISRISSTVRVALICSSLYLFKNVFSYNIKYRDYYNSVKLNNLTEIKIFRFKKDPYKVTTELYQG